MIAVAASTGRRTGRMWIHGLDGAAPTLEVTAIPLEGSGAGTSARPRSSGSEPSEGHLLGHPRVAGRARTGHRRATAATPRAWRSQRRPARGIVLDAGTGHPPPRHRARARGRARVDILLTHLHMDHIQGLGFFAPLLRRRPRGAHLGAGVGDRGPARAGSPATCRRRCSRCGCATCRAICTSTT